MSDDLNPQSFKDFVNSRGYKYHYYYTAAKEGKSTLLFVHGFPSLARDWRRVALPLEKLGYGIIIPDMLGYGGSDRPVDPADYKMKAIGKDLIDILDAEKVEKAVAIGHDWGSIIVSRLVNYFSERFIAYAFFAVSYLPPQPEANFDRTAAMMTHVMGYNPVGYWYFFNEDDADKVIVDHWDSFVSIIYPKDANVAKEVVCPKDNLKNALLADTIPPEGRAWYMNDEEKKIYSDIFLDGAIAGTLGYYRALMRGLNVPDETEIPLMHKIPSPTTPLFYGAALYDPVCTPQVGKATFALDVFKNHKVTIRDFDGDHWIPMSHGDAIAKELDAWITESSL